MNKISLLTIKGCHHCEKAKEMLDKHGIIYLVIDCDQTPEAIPTSIKESDIVLPLLKVQDNHFIIGGNFAYLKEIIEKILGL